MANHSLSQEQIINEIIKPIRYYSTGAFDVDLDNIKNSLNSMSNVFSEPVDFNPEFQRGYVWNSEQEIAYVEALLQNKLSKQAKLISFNRAGYTHKFSSDNPNYDERIHNKIVCIDGKQRLNTLLKFINNEFNVFKHELNDFKGFSYSDLHDRRITINIDYMIRFEFYEFDTYKELLKFYIDFNSGGTVHDKSEIMRVQSMLDKLQ